MRKITIKLPGSNSFSGSTGSPRPEGTPTAMSPNQSFPPQGQQTPRPLSITIPATPGIESRPKIKLTPRTSLPPTPAAGSPPPPAAAAAATMAPPPQPVVKSKAGRVMKPTAKKRAIGDMDSDDDDQARPTVNGHSTTKKIRLAAGTPSTPAPPITPGGMRLKVKGLGKPPSRPPGDGYDSEAEDREIDPVIEEQFILRMMPGEHCEYLKECIREKKIGLPKSQGGADVAMRWVDADGRRCMVTVKGQNYAGILLDLPTITEAMKTWDKKGMVKSADICQMLLVFARVQNEDEAKTAPLPKTVDHGYRWPHGLTPPMHDCIHRRFRKRLSKMEIQNKDAEVERLLRSDKEAVSTKYEFIDESKAQENGEEEEEEYEYEDGEEYEEDAEAEADAEGEVDDYFGDGATHNHGQEEEEVEDDLDALFEQEFADDMAEDETPAAATGLEAATPMTATNGETPTTQTADEAAGADNDEGESEEEESEEDGEEEGDFGDEEGDDGEDGDQRDRIAGIRREIADLEKKKANFLQTKQTSASLIMKKRMDSNIKNTENEILLKKRLIGEVPDDD